MEALSKREKELVSLGAALGSSCVPCVVYHIKEALKNGVIDGQIKEAIELAGKVRSVSTAQIQNTAYAQLGNTDEEKADSTDGEKPDCCG